MNEFDAIGGLMMHNHWVMLAGAAMLALAWLARHRECSCPKCEPHVRERRLAQERAAEREHDFQHKGDRFLTSPDRFDCADIRCPRNNRNRPSS